MKIFITFIITIIIILIILKYKNHNEKFNMDKLLLKLKSYDFKYFNENNNIINHLKEELNEQLLVEKYIKPDDIVLELGARYGTVTCIINKKLNNKNNLVSVEPDKSIWNALDKNLLYNDCKTNIVKGFISNRSLSLNSCGYASHEKIDLETQSENYSLDYIKKKYNISKFTVLIADCEGCLELFLEDNQELLFTLRMIIFEKDNLNICNYNKIKFNLKLHNFKQIYISHHEVWIKK
jgi:FkbM family methyltransferase